MPHPFRARRPRRSDDGFTLVELLVVVVIIGILIAIAIPLYLNYTRSSNDKGAQSDVRNAVSVLESCNSDNGGYPSSMPFASATTKPCGLSVTTSNGTTLTYLAKSDSTSYNLFGTNAGGSAKAGTAYYCYNAKTGGSVVKKTGAVPTSYSDTAC